MQLTPKHEADFRAAIQEIFPSMPKLRVKAIADHHFAIEHPTLHHSHSGTEWIVCLVAAHVRHNLTDYESRFPTGIHAPELKHAARIAVQREVNHYLNQWRELR